MVLALDHVAQAGKEAFHHVRVLAVVAVNLGVVHAVNVSQSCRVSQWDASSADMVAMRDTFSCASATPSPSCSPTNGSTRPSDADDILHVIIVPASGQFSKRCSRKILVKGSYAGSPRCIICKVGHRETERSLWGPAEGCNVDPKGLAMLLGSPPSPSLHLIRPTVRRHPWSPRSMGPGRRTLISHFHADRPARPHSHPAQGFPRLDLVRTELQVMLNAIDMIEGQGPQRQG